MNKSRGVLIVKIIAIVVWLLSLLSPTIFTEIEKVEMKDFNQIEHIEQTETTYYFEIEFTKEIESGTITMGFYDEEGHLLFAQSVPFENNKSNKVVIAVENEKFVEFRETLADYKFEYANITTKTASIIEKVMYPVSIVLAVALVFVLRIRYKEYEVEGKKVQIYAGIVNHTIYVDNIQAYSERYLLTNKKTTLAVPLSETQEMEIIFRANNRIETMVRNRPVVENGDVVLSAIPEELNETSSKEVIEEKTNVEIDTKTVEEKIEETSTDETAENK